MPLELGPASEQDLNSLASLSQAKILWHTQLGGPKELVKDWHGLQKNVKLGLLPKPRWNSRGGQYWPSLGRKELEACGKQLLKHPHIKSADPSGKTMPRKLGPSLEQDLKSLANLSQTIILLWEPRPVLMNWQFVCTCLDGQHTIWTSLGQTRANNKF